MEIDKERYKRNILLPEVGEEGQKKLAESRVLVVGAGDLDLPPAYIWQQLESVRSGLLILTGWMSAICSGKSFTGNRTLERQKQNWRRSSFRAGTIRCR